MLKANLRPSWTLAAILLLAHGAAIDVIAIIDLPLWLKLVVVTALVLNCVREVWRRAFLRSRDAVVALETSSDNVLSIQIRRGEWLECEVLGSSYVISYLVILNLRPAGGGATLRAIILPDSIAADDFRELRVWLRWKRPAAD